ncbi:pyocin knob domain-containing protein [Rhizobium sp.]|uniref:pyocin knob domain-containing protein n=1 Tax=Rhizobium sp. TaxID=391 RepID=UPI0028A8CE41
MAGVAYYNIGTATVAVNSKTVTGTGTNWLSVVGGLTAIKAGDKFGIHVGRPIIIASVDSNTQLTLEDNWPGPAQTNAVYKIELTSPDVIAVEALRRVLGSLSGGILYGVSQLTAAPNKALTIDETGAVALADLTTFGKSLIAALNSSAAYGALGVIPNAQLPERLRSFATRVADWNSARDSGVYFGDGSTANTPASPFAFIGFVTSYTSTYFVQRLVAFGNVGTANNIEYVRECSNGTFGPWARVRSTEAELDARYNRVSQVIANSQLPDRLRNLVPIVSDPNAISATGFYGFLGDAPNLPYPNEAFLVQAIVWADPSYQIQRAWSVLNNTVEYRRTKINNVWQPWLALGDVRGPASSVDNALASFSGTTGKVLKGTPNGAVTNNYLANVATATLKGRATAGTGAVEDLTAAQARTVIDVVPSAARQIRLGAQGVATTVIDQWTIAPSGSFLTAIRSDGIYAAREVAYRAVQQTDVSGNWVTVAQV